MEDSHSIKSLLKNTSKQLSVISDSPLLDAELLLAHCLEKNRTFLHTWPETRLTEIQLAQFYSLIEKRLTDYPVAYLLGKKEFWSLEFIVTPDVLIPRPETELLVENALDKIKNIADPMILDLGTGCGAIALSLASERPDATIVATDFSSKALEVAKTNAERLKLHKHMSFIQSDWFEQLNSNNANFDLIVSNPPYIDPEDPHLKQTIRHEPQQALVAENKGMSDIKKIIQKSHLFLNTGGWLMLEHGYDQATLTKQLFKKYQFSRTQNLCDLNDNFRITIGLVS